MANFIKAINKGLLKTFSKMGISTLQSYRGAQVFEAIGLNRELVDRYFTGTASRIDGVGLDVLAREAMRKPPARLPPAAGVRDGAGRRRQLSVPARGEYHLFNPRDHRQAAARRAAGELRRPSRNTPT